MDLFLNNANINNQEFKEIFSWFSIITNIVAMAGYGISDMIN